MTYYKLVAIHNDVNWYLKEFSVGRARYGWSSPGKDLSVLDKKDSFNDEEKITWRYSKFLFKRIKVGDRIVVQTEQPLESFLIGEVVSPGYEFRPGNFDDFNHVLNIIPLTAKPIPINSYEVTASLKHDLSKRGNYYEIYPESSIKQLNQIVRRAKKNELDLNKIRTYEDTLDRTSKEIRKEIIKHLHDKWRSKDFEELCKIILEQMDYVEVKEKKDSGKGWDLLIRILNPITNSILADDVPVQCKNFTGKVITNRPIEDLERAMRNCDSSIAYLMIMGDLTDEYKNLIVKKQQELESELKRPIIFEIIDQDTIAKIYSQYSVKIDEMTSGSQ